MTDKISLGWRFCGKCGLKYEQLNCPICYSSTAVHTPTSITWGLTCVRCHAVMAPYDHPGFSHSTSLYIQAASHKQHCIYCEQILFPKEETYEK